jgi:hypothetical protein
MPIFFKKTKKKELLKKSSIRILADLCGSLGPHLGN